jgi:ABC-type transport system involved in multi-copper enzyme maturation permease subunit
MIRALWPVAVITYKEGIRNRAVYGISILALLLLAANLVVSGMVMREIGKVAIDMALSAVSFAGLLVVLFVGINLMAKDLDRKTIYMVLSRPISRSQYVVGKFFGMVLLLLVTMSVLGGFAIASVLLVQAGYPDYALNVSWPTIGLALIFSTLSLILLSALSFLFAAFTSTSFITLVLTIVTYLIGHSISDVKALVDAPETIGIQVSPVAAKLVQGAYYLFPNLSLFDIKTQAAHALEVPWSYVFSTVGYGMVYTVLAVTVAALIFRRREFP